jgi:hypothetical protein
MTFRDYAQGAYRMRGIGKGQRIHLFIIPEVENRIRQELESISQFTSKLGLDVPAWLLINSMRVESLQFVQMSLQELYNIFRKRSLKDLLDEHAANALQPSDPGYNSVARLHRFTGTSDVSNWLHHCVELFREPISYTVPDSVPVARPFQEKVQQLIVANDQFVVPSSAEAERVKLVAVKLGQIGAQQDSSAEEDGGHSLTSEVVHENEQEEEAEEEAEEEEQKMSAFSRDDEQHNPWAVHLLTQPPSGQTGGEKDEAFYLFSKFQARPEQSQLTFPPNLLLSDNFFRPRWCGLGDRRLKGAHLIMEWIPEAMKQASKARLLQVHAALMSGEHGDGTAPMDPNTAAAVAMQIITNPGSAPASLQAILHEPVDVQVFAASRRLVAVSLAEAETLRRIIHVQQDSISGVGLALRALESGVIDQTDHFVATCPGDDDELAVGIQCMRFFNGDMWYSDDELALLQKGLKDTPLERRVCFFSECLRLRRAERLLWEDTPLAKIFTAESEWHLLHMRARVVQVKRKMADKKLQPAQFFERFDADGDGILTHKELVQAFEMDIGFSPADSAEVVRYLDQDKQG